MRSSKREAKLQKGGTKSLTHNSEKNPGYNKTRERRKGRGEEEEGEMEKQRAQRRPIRLEGGPEKLSRRDGWGMKGKRNPKKDLESNLLEVREGIISKVGI